MASFRTAEIPQAELLNIVMPRNVYTVLMINLSMWQKAIKITTGKIKRSLNMHAPNINLATSGEHSLLLPVPLLPPVRTSASQQDAWLWKRERYINRRGKKNYYFSDTIPPCLHLPIAEENPIGQFSFSFFSSSFLWVSNIASAILSTSISYFDICLIFVELDVSLTTLFRRLCIICYYYAPW